MALSLGIVGLPNVGKSTLYTALTRKALGANGSPVAANYPFATIEPNVGLVSVPDSRLDALAEIVSPQRVLPAVVEFVDIAGLVAGASKGEGLGNQFLANIRETDAICEVVRYFTDENVIHVDGKVNPESDVETIRTELVLADLATIERALPRLEKEAKKDKAGEAKVAVLHRLQEWMDQGHRAAKLDMTVEERELVRDLHLLTMKPMLYVANVDESQVADDFAPIDGVKPIPICAKVEADLADLEPEEAAEYLAELGLTEPGLNALIREAYGLLGLQSYFTAGVQEVRAWTVPVGAKAPQAAGVIHTDFERGFIKAEVIGYEEYVALGGEKGAKEAGKMRLEGKEYVMADGDVVHFKFNV
ncbi:MAG: redox-regulated ATPase YchF [Coriobacteriia bacterium]|nr:redox-regulated ATPase YchF [Coriobacteriia bacterium]